MRCRTITAIDRAAVSNKQRGSYATPLFIAVKINGTQDLVHLQVDCAALCCIEPGAGDTSSGARRRRRGKTEALVDQVAQGLTGQVAPPVIDELIRHDGFEFGEVAGHVR